MGELVRVRKYKSATGVRLLRRYASRNDKSICKFVVNSNEQDCPVVAMTTGVLFYRDDMLSWSLARTVRVLDILLPAEPCQRISAFRSIISSIFLQASNTVA